MLVLIDAHLKKNEFATSVLVMVALAAALVLPVAAADPTTTATAVVTESVAPGLPLNPENPDPANPPMPGPTGTGMGGPLSLDYVPSLSFGTGLELKTYTSTSWKVSATASQMTSTDVTEHMITGAKIKFSAGRPTGDRIGMNGVNTPTTAAFDLACTGNTGDTKLAFTASSGDGFGVWVNRWYPSTPAIGDNSQIGLEIPENGAKALEYSCTITWEMGDTP